MGGRPNPAAPPNPADLHIGGKPADEIGEFFLLKHLFALQSTLKTLTGACPAGPGQQCAVSEIHCDENEIKLIGHIAVNVVAEEISACRPCKKCSTRKSPEHSSIDQQNQ